MWRASGKLALENLFVKNAYTSRGEFVNASGKVHLQKMFFFLTIIIKKIIVTSQELNYYPVVKNLNTL